MHLNKEDGVTCVRSSRWLVLFLFDINCSRHLSNVRKNHVSLKNRAVWVRYFVFLPHATRVSNNAVVFRIFLCGCHKFSILRRICSIRLIHNVFLTTYHFYVFIRTFNCSREFNVFFERWLVFCVAFHLEPAIISVGQEPISEIKQRHAFVFFFQTYKSHMRCERSVMWKIYTFSICFDCVSNEIRSKISIDSTNVAMVMAMSIFWKHLWRDKNNSYAHIVTFEFPIGSICVYLPYFWCEFFHFILTHTKASLSWCRYDTACALWFQGNRLSVDRFHSDQYRNHPSP